MQLKYDTRTANVFRHLSCPAIALIVLSACASKHIENTVDTGGTLPISSELIDKSDNDDLSDVAAPLERQDLNAPPGYPQKGEDLIYGDQTFVDTSATPLQTTSTETDASGGENFIFRKAPIDAVVQEILGEAFNLSYSIAPDVRGEITLRLDGISTPEQAVNSLGAVLELQGYEIKNTSGSYLVNRKGATGNSLKTPVFIGENDTIPSDASMAVLQVRFAQLSDITELARVMLPNGLIKHEDNERGFIVLEGEPAAVSSGIQLLKSLDVNWLSSVSTAMMPIETARASELAADLEPVLARLGGVSVVPLDRMGSLMVIARRHDSLDQVRSWVARLDKQSKPRVSGDTLVYEARYIDAGYLSEIISGSGGGSGGSGFSGQSDNNLEDAPAYEPAERAASRRAPSPEGRAGGLYEELSITVDESRNTIIARGPSEALQSLNDLFLTIDQPKRQVLIKATIVEVGLNETNQFGVQWDFIANQLRASFSDIGSGAVTSLFPGASLSFVNSDIQAVINVLALTSDVEIVSSPRVLVLNNETARLQIGDQVPVITQSAVSITDPGAPIVNSTSYRDTGVILTVTPSIRAGGMVEIEISQEVSSVAETSSSSIDSPTISQRTIESRLAVPDGSTAVLGGLMSSTRSFNETGVPVLKDIPVVGHGFRSTGVVERRTELVILVEPTVVLSEDPIIDIPARLREALINARLEG